MDGRLRRQVLDTEDLPPRERFGTWLDMMASSPTPLRMHTAHADDFVARAEFVELGRMRLIRYRYPSVDCVRTSKLIQRSDPDYYLLALTLTGTSQADQAGQRARCRPGDLTFYDCSRPHEVSHHADPAGPAYARSIVALMPYDALPLPRRRLAPLFAGRMSGSEGVGGLLADFLIRVTASPRAVPRGRRRAAGRDRPGPDRHAARPQPGLRGGGTHRDPAARPARPGALVRGAAPRRRHAGPGPDRRRAPHLGALAAPALRGRGDHRRGVHQ